MRLFINLSRDKLAVTSIAIIVVTMILGVCAPFFAPHDPGAVNMKLRYASPSWPYLLGNDHLGRCVLSRLIYGIRPSVLWVLAALGFSVLIGAAAGFIAGYFKGKVDAWLMRICDIMLSFPGYVMTLAVVGILGAGLENILIAFVCMKWAWFARVIRTSVMQFSDMDYVKFAKASGIPSWTSHHSGNLCRYRRNLQWCNVFHDAPSVGAILPWSGHSGSPCRVGHDAE